MRLKTGPQRCFELHGAAAHHHADNRGAHTLFSIPMGPACGAAAHAHRVCSECAVLTSCTLADSTAASHIGFQMACAAKDGAARCCHLYARCHAGLVCVLWYRTHSQPAGLARVVSGGSYRKLPHGKYMHIMAHITISVMSLPFNRLHLV